jgi:hypothetical protein
MEAEKALMTNKKVAVLIRMTIPNEIMLAPPQAGLPHPCCARQPAGNLALAIGAKVPSFNQPSPGPTP